MGKRVALLLGVNEPGAASPAGGIDCAEEDARRVAALLRDSCRFETVEIRTGVDVNVKSIESFVAGVKHQPELFVLYFAGPAETVNSRVHLYGLPSPGEGRPPSLDLDQTLSAACKRLRPEQVLVIIDAPRKSTLALGGPVRPWDPEVFRFRLHAGEGVGTHAVFVLFGCGREGSCWEDPDPDLGGLLTKALVETIAHDPEGCPLHRVHQRIADRTLALSNMRATEHPQHPVWMASSGGAELYLRTLPAVTAEPERELPPPPEDPSPVGPSSGRPLKIAAGPAAVLLLVAAWGLISKQSSTPASRSPERSAIAPVSAGPEPSRRPANNSPQPSSGSHRQDSAERSPSLSSVPPPPPPGEASIDFSSDPSEIGRGETATLLWALRNARNATISPGIGAVPSEGRAPVAPGSTTSYTLVAEDLHGNTLRSSVTLKVKAPVEIISFSAEPRQVYLNDDFEFAWSTRDATLITIELVDKPPSSRASFSTTIDHPEGRMRMNADAGKFTKFGDYEFRLVAKGAGEPKTATVTVAIVERRKL